LKVGLRFDKNGEKLFEPIECTKIIKREQLMETIYLYYELKKINQISNWH
jgi:hypothetical protein